MKSIIFYRDGCIGCNSCVEHAPKFWKLSDKDGKSCLRGAIKIRTFFIRKIRPEDFEDNEKVSKDCPVNIIKIS